MKTIKSELKIVKTTSLKVARLITEGKRPEALAEVNRFADLFLAASIRIHRLAHEAGIRLHGLVINGQPLGDSFRAMAEDVKTALDSVVRGDFVDLGDTFQYLVPEHIDTLNDVIDEIRAQAVTA